MQIPRKIYGKPSPKNIKSNAKSMGKSWRKPYIKASTTHQELQCKIQGNNSGKPYRRATTKQPKKTVQNSRGEFKEFPTGRLPPNAKITMQNPSEQLRQTVQKSHYKSPKSHRKAWKNMKRKGTTNPPIIHIKIHRNILGKNIQKTETQKLQSQNQILKETHNT